MAKKRLNKKVVLICLVAFVFFMLAAIGVISHLSRDVEKFVRVEGDKFERFEKYSSNPLSIPRYGAKGVLHPDVLYFPDGIDGYKYWMVYTPYPPDSKEEASIVRSNDGLSWTDAGISNPVVPRGGRGAWDEFHIPDPDMLYVPELSKWFMVYVGSAAGAGRYRNRYKETTIGIAYSTDGKSWTKKGVLVDGMADYEQYAGERACLQPSLVYENGTFYLWYVVPVSSATLGANNRRKVCMVTFTWNNTTNEVENFMRDDNNPIFYAAEDHEFKSGVGHIDVSYYDGTYYMYAVRELLDSINWELALFKSTNKTSWTNKGKVLARGLVFHKHIYRAGPVTDGIGMIVLFRDEVKFYFSGYTTYPWIGLAHGREEIKQ